MSLRMYSDGSNYFFTIFSLHTSNSWLIDKISNEDTFSYINNGNIKKKKKPVALVRVYDF